METFLRHYILTFIAGSMYALCLPGSVVTLPFPLGILGIALLLAHPTLLRIALFSLGYCCFAQYWVAHTLQEFGGIPFHWSILLTGAYSLITLPQYFVFVLLLRLLRPYPTPSWLQHPSRKNILIALTLTSIEYYCPQLFPHHFGYHWLQITPQLGLAPIGGVPLFSFFSFWIALGLIHWYRNRQADHWCTVCAVLFLALNICIPLKSSEKPWQILQARLVQANIGNFMKIDAQTGSSRSWGEIEQTFLSLSKSPSDRPLDLILWPETALPLVFDSNPDRPPPSVIAKTIANTGASLVTGVYNRVPGKEESLFETRYNAFFFYNSRAQLNGIYRKQKLIPFGETLPFGPLNQYLAHHIKNLSFFAKGKEYPLFKMENGSRFIGIICYEILFSQYLRKYINRQPQPPHFIVNPSNDSWYGDSAEPYQHRFLAHWRALEFNLPIIRITNTGISSVLFPDGTESQRIKFSQKGILDVAIPVYERRPTVFEPLRPPDYLVEWFLIAIGNLFSK